MDKDIAIKVDHVSKTFKIPHEKVSSLRGAAVNAFKKKSYEEFKALDDVSFEIKKGEFFGIIGRNGSGKSTLLKILAGIYQTDKGKVHIDGRISPFLELGIGFNPELSGRDNVYLNATVLGMTKKQIDDKFDSIVAFSELERFIDQKLKNYSSGMQVRLAFSVSIHANREILLMDEVLAVGDSNFQSKCLEQFSKYRDMGKTVILVSHDIATIQRYCDRAMLIRNGKVIKIGKSGDVVDKYIHDNIIDEEELTSKNTSDGVVSYLPVSSGIAKITKVEFLNRDWKPTKVFKTGDDISVRVYFDQYKNASILNFGLGIYNQEGVYISGMHTIADKMDTKLFMEKGYFQLDFKNIPLRANSYYVQASIVEKNYLPYISFVSMSDVFKIISVDEDSQGVIILDYNWNI